LLRDAFTNSIDRRHGDAIFEGADVIYVRDGVVLVATGLRTDSDGANQVAAELKRMGFDPHIVNMPWGCGHIDGGINIVGPRTAVMVPNNAPHAAYELLKKMGFTIVNAMAFLIAIFSAVYALSLYRRVVFGEMVNPKLEGIADLETREILIFAPLVVSTLVLGVYPNSVFEITGASVNHLIAMWQTSGLH
jgi:N-dimethylarginine dimethylaminohydrolase